MIEDVITAVMKREGWDTYTNKPADRGGPTKWGITLKAWQEYRGPWSSVTPDDIKEITEPQARDFYEEMYVYGPRFQLLPDKLVELVVDCGINHGTKAAAKWVQRACGALQDGVIGPKTIAAVQAENPLSVYLRICAYRTKLFGRLVSKDPKLAIARQAGHHLQAEFASGWNNRAMHFVLDLADQISTR
jgi:lysozyme family protein